MSEPNENSLPDADLERALRDRLRAVPPPDGFADRVLAHAARRAHRPWRVSRPLATVAALLLVALLLAGGAYRRDQRRRQAEAATLQFSLAMRVTGAALARAGESIHLHAHPNPSTLD